MQTVATNRYRERPQKAETIFSRKGPKAATEKKHSSLCMSVAAERRRKPPQHNGSARTIATHSLAEKKKHTRRAINYVILLTF